MPLDDADGRCDVIGSDKQAAARRVLRITESKGVCALRQALPAGFLTAASSLNWGDFL